MQEHFPLKVCGWLRFWESENYDSRFVSNNSCVLLGEGRSVESAACNCQLLLLSIISTPNVDSCEQNNKTLQELWMLSTVILLIEGSLCLLSSQVSEMSPIWQGVIHFKCHKYLTKMEQVSSRHDICQIFYPSLFSSI